MMCERRAGFTGHFFGFFSEPGAMRKKWMMLPGQGICLVGMWLLGLAWFGGVLPEQFPGMALLLTAWTGCFLLLGPLAGGLVTCLLAVSGEAVCALPAGRMLFAVFSAGLVLLHLSRIASWSLIGRGLAMTSLAAGVWQSLLGLFELGLPGAAGGSIAMSGEVLVAMGLAGGCWLMTAVVLIGVWTVWKETGTRPVRSGSEY